MLKRKMVFGLVLILVLTLLSAIAQTTYSDVSGTKYEEAVNVLSALNILSGYEDGTFMVNNNLTRAEAVKLLCKLAGVDLNEASNTVFEDVPKNYWASGYINIASNMGIVSGEDDGNFYPDRDVTYEQFIKMIVIALGYNEEAQACGGYPIGYFTEAQYLKITANIELEWEEPITRGDTALVIYNSLNVPVKEKQVYNVTPSPSATPVIQATPSAANETFYDVASPKINGASGGGGGGSYGISGYIPPENYNTEEYSANEENNYKSALEDPVSTFSIDVDTASYSNIRRILNGGQLPTGGAVRIEEMINYFSYDYPQPEDGEPFSVNTEVAKCPWNEGHNLALVNLQGRNISMDKLPPNNLVFLIDVSGSMRDENKLPLLKESLSLMVDKMRPQDKISIVVYASGTGVLLSGAGGNDKENIENVIRSLGAGGSTAGSAGIQLAYETAKNNFIPNGNNRVILGTDGDFNVGANSESDLETLIEEKRDCGIGLSVLGFGMGNIKDNKMELLADKGNGNYAYIDSIQEAKKVLVGQLAGTLYTIAKDVKIQVEFNPAKVKEYRLIGYENRLLDSEDFNDDTKDAGELGAGHTVTALYELVPADSKEVNANTDALKYQTKTVSSIDELLTIKLRYKEPAEDESKLITKSLDSNIGSTMSENMGFAAAVAEFGLLLSDSEYKGNASYESVIKRASDNSKNDAEGYRADFISIVKKAMALEK